MVLVKITGRPTTLERGDVMNKGKNDVIVVRFTLNGRGFGALVVDIY